MKLLKRYKISLIFISIFIIFIIGIITTVLVVKNNIKEPHYYTINTNYIFNNETSYDLTFEVYSSEKIDKNLNKNNIEKSILFETDTKQVPLTIKNIDTENKAIKTDFDTVYLYYLRFEIPSILSEKFISYKNASLKLETKQKNTLFIPLGNVEIINNNIFTNQQYITVNNLIYDKKDIKTNLAPKKINIRINDGYSVKINEIRFGFLENEMFEVEYRENEIILYFKQQNLFLNYLTIFFVLEDQGREIIQRHYQPLNYDINYDLFFKKAKEMNLLNIVV